MRIELTAVDVRAPAGSDQLRLPPPIPRRGAARTVNRFRYDSPASARRNIGSARHERPDLGPRRLHTDASGKDHTCSSARRAAGYGKSNRRRHDLFKPVFDEQPVQSIGAIALDPSNPKNVWVGSGESWTRKQRVDRRWRPTSPRMPARPWTHVGLPNSERISRIIVDPALGRHGLCLRARQAVERLPRARSVQDHRQRAAPWQLILKGANLSTGCGSIALDPRAPDVLFASLWDLPAQGVDLSPSGGRGGRARFSGSALYRRRGWRQELGPKLTPQGEQGLPRKAVRFASRSQWRRVIPGTVYAFVESTDSALIYLPRRRQHLGGAVTRANGWFLATVSTSPT